MDSILFPFNLPSRNLLRICEENHERTYGNGLSPDQYMSSVPINSCRKVLRKSVVICSYMPLLEIWGPIDTHPHTFTNRVVVEHFYVDKYCQPMVIVGIHDVVMNSSCFPSNSIRDRKNTTEEMLQEPLI